MRTMHACDQPRTYACQPFIIIINNILSHDMMTRHPSAITYINYKLLPTEML